MAADALPMTGFPLGSNTSPQPNIAISRPETIAAVQPVQEVLTEQPNDLALNQIGEDFFSGEQSRIDKALSDLNLYFQRLSDAHQQAPQEIFQFLIEVFNEIQPQDASTLGQLVVELSENIDALDFHGISDGDLANRLRAALNRLGSLNLDNAYVSRFITTLDSRLPVAAISPIESPADNAKVANLIDILKSEAANNEVKLVSAKDLYLELGNELKKTPVEVKTVNMILNCYIQIAENLDLESEALLKNGTFENTILRIVFTLKRYFNSETSSGPIGLTQDFWSPFEQNLMHVVDTLSEIPAGRNASDLIIFIVENPERTFLIWSDTFKTQLIQRLFLALDSNQGFRTFEKVLSIFFRTGNQESFTLMLNWLQTRASEELINIVLRVLTILDQRDNNQVASSLANLIERNFNKGVNLELDNLVRLIMFMNADVEAGINARLLQEDVEKSTTIEDDLKTVYQGFDKFINKDRAVQVTVESNIANSNLQRLANRVPIPGLRNAFNNKWKEHQTSVAATSVEAQAKVEIGNSVNLLSQYVLGEPEGKSPEEFLRFILIPANIALLRNIFSTLVDIYQVNNPAGFRDQIAGIFNKTLFNPQFVQIMPAKVKEFAIGIWDTSLNVASVDNDVEYKARREELIKLKNGQTVVNTSRKFLDEQTRKQNELTKIYDKISKQRYMTIVELKRVLASPDLFAFYSQVPAFKALLEKLFATTLDRKPMNAQDLDILNMIYLTGAWDLLSDSIKDRVTQVVLISYTTGQNEYAELVDQIRAGRAEICNFVASVLWKFMTTNAEFRARVVEYMKPHAINLAEYKLIYNIRFLLDKANLNSEEGNSEPKRPEEQNLVERVFGYFDTINHTSGPRDLIRTIRECYMLLDYSDLDAATITNMFASVNPEQSRLLSLVLSKLILIISLNKRNLVLCSLSEALFNKILEAAPAGVVAAGQNNPFEVVAKIKEVNPTKNLEVSGTLQDKIVSMQTNYNQKVPAAVAA